MTRSQNQKLKRLLSVDNCFSTNPTTTAALYNSAVWTVQLENYIAEIIAHSQTQATSNAGGTQSKTVLKAKLADLGFFIVVCAKSYARSVNDIVLYEKINFSLANLKKQNDTDLLNSANIIYTEANASIAAISAMTTLTASQIADFKQTITDFTKFIPQAQIGRNGVKFHTQEIARLITESDLLLKEIADHAEVTRFTDPAFYHQYTSANKVGNAITRNRALQINVVDKATKIPVFKADVSITDSKGGKIADRKTTAKGNSFIQDLKESDYNVSVMQAGYKKTTTTISITDGNTALVSVELETL